MRLRLPKLVGIIQSVKVEDFSGFSQDVFKLSLNFLFFVESVFVSVFRQLGVKKFPSKVEHVLDLIHLFPLCKKQGSKIFAERG